MITAKEAKEIADKNNTVNSDKLNKLYKEIKETAREGAYGLATGDLKLSYKEQRTLEMDGFKVEVGANPSNPEILGYLIKW